ncbi:MAG TPA: EamA family transporter [Ktedonosporobacter sp.]|nr:EamA family transporter [Ktedonosporobacter sp.]
MRAAARQRFIGYLMVATATLLFGLNGNISRLLFDNGISPITLVEFRMLIGGFCLLAVLLIWGRGALKLPSRSWGWIIAFGLSLALVTYTYFVAISRLPLAIALVIQFSATAWMALGEAIWRRKLPSRAVLLAVFLTFFGVILLTGVWHLSLNGLDALGLLFAILALVTYIAYLLIGRRVGRTLPALTSTTYGALVACVFWFIVQPPWSIPAMTWQPQHLWLILLVGILGMAIPFSLMLAALRRLDATRAGIAGMLELVSASVIGYFWLGQHLTLWQIVGCTLVLVGVIILQYEQQG